VIEELDVIVAGAGLSGIGAAYRLKTECPLRTFAVLEARDGIGGTWDLFRYPGVRSDSDMFTLGYPFHPWREAKAIADGPSILAYVRETARKFELEPHIRFGQRVVEARWSSAQARWTVHVEAGGVRKQLRCRFLYLCCGYYDYSAAYVPKLEGLERFKGRVLHPQWWPEGFDWSGQRVVVIGSGATAVTVVPAMAERAAHVTMLQRSPTYVISRPARDRLADFLRAVLPDEIAHTLVRVKDVLVQLFFYKLARARPELVARGLRQEAAKLLPPGYPVEKHFAPRYNPWDQRLCLVPNADLFEAISSGKASIVTDTIETFDETGIRLSSGERLDADVVVTATGLKVLPIGGARLSVDGRVLRAHDLLVYKGMMLSDVPNLAFCVGYTNASWTLRADLSSRYVCRVLNHMEQNGFDVAMPRSEAAGPGRRPLFNFNSGYVLRSLPDMPQQGDRAPWTVRQNYVLDYFETLYSRVDDEAMAFSRRSPTLPTSSESPAPAP
jgi:cation diffusion facilitator CzcD-associated flavoprotein CzcO